MPRYKMAIETSWRPEDAFDHTADGAQLELRGFD
jgi:hypothetical protein